MADVRVERPQAGQAQVVPSEDGAKFIFDFDASQTPMQKDGSNLVIDFGDGASVTLENFYDTYTAENLPSFEIDGEEISAQQFFAAMNKEDLMPASGPAAGTAGNGARYHDFGTSALASGIDHLERLDWNTTRSFEPETADWLTYPDDPDDDGDNPAIQPVAEPVNHPITLTPINPGSIPPGTPNLPPDGKNPGENPGDNPGNTPGGTPGELALGNDVRLVREADLDDGKASVDGAFKIDAPDGLATINVGGQNIWVNGVMNANARFETDEGVFHNFAYNAETGVLTYTFTLGHATQEHGAQGADNIAHSLPVSVTDTDGDMAHGQMTIVIEDDVPTIEATAGETRTNVNKSILIDFTGQNGSTVDTFHALFASQDEHWELRQHPMDEKYSPAEANHAHWVIVNGIKLIPTHVLYDSDGSSIDNLVDKNGINGEFGNLTYRTDKVLTLTEDGIGMGTKTSASDKPNWGNEQFGTNGADRGQVYSDAFVIEPDNGSVWYQLDIDLSNFEAGDKAVVYFYLTPQNNNDDNIVYKYEITADGSEGGKQSVSIPVPDGFTKAILAPIPNNGVHSEFTVARLNLSKNTWEHNGTLGIDFGADEAAAAESVTVDWSGITGAIGENQINVWETPGAGTYTVKFQYSDDGLTLKAILQGQKGGEFSLHGNPLFIATIDPANGGSWTIDQFYKFDWGTDENAMNGIKNLHFSVSVKDADDDVAMATPVIDMWLDHGLDRFDNVELGYYDKTNWGAEAAKDNAYDLLQGGQGNDLMYGRGGNDLMFGDDANGTALNDLVNVLKDHRNYNEDFNNFDANIAGKFEEVASAEAYQPGNNKAAHTQILLNGLNELRDTAFEVREGHLNDFLKDFESKEQPGGDDALYGGLGRDVMFGGAGDDYLVGSGDKDAKQDPNYKNGNSQDEDMLFGGSGNDIIVYDPQDFIIHGGSGIDVLLAGNATTYKGSYIGAQRCDIQHLWEIQQNLNADGTKVADKAHVESMEVLIRSEHTQNVENLGITSQKALAEKYGVTISHGKNGEPDSMTLSDAWHEQGPAHVVQNDQGDWVTYHTYKYVDTDNGVELTLETSLQPGSDGVFHPVELSDQAPNSDNGMVLIGNYDNSEINGGAGNDYLDGGAGKDRIDAGAGNDVIMYDMKDSHIDGGTGIDLLLTNDNERELFKDWQGKTDYATLRQLHLSVNKVSNVEMMLIGKNNTNIKELGITNLNALAAYGIVVMGNDIHLNTDYWQAKGWPNHSDGRLTAEGQTNQLFRFMHDGDDGHFTLEIVKPHDGYPNIVLHNSITMPSSEEDPLPDDPTGGPETYSLHPDHSSSHNDSGDDSGYASVASSLPRSGGNAPDAQPEEQSNQQSDEVQDFLAEVEALGGNPDDALIFNNGDDLIKGADGKEESIFAGGGNDLIALDNSDFLIDGGSGIDIMLASQDNARYSLNDMLDNYLNKGENGDMPMVNGVEVLIKGADLNDIHNLQDLQDKYGIKLDQDANGKDRITLDKNWSKGDDGKLLHTGENGDTNVTIETTLEFSNPGDGMDILVATQQVQAETGGNA